MRSNIGGQIRGTAFSVGLVIASLQNQFAKDAQDEQAKAKAEELAKSEIKVNDARAYMMRAIGYNKRAEARQALMEIAKDKPTQEANKKKRKSNLEKYGGEMDGNTGSSRS